MAALSPHAPRLEAQAAVSVRAAGRLHLGFLDPSATLGRRFGSLGLVIEGHETEVDIAPARADALLADGAAAEAELVRAAAHLQRLRERTGLRSPLVLHLRSVLPAHAGYGSGTQLALGIGRAFARCHGLEVPTATIASWLGRGQRSGIGIAGFDQGGLIVDGGPGADGAPAAVIARLSLPEAWRIVVVEDPRRRGLSGDEERAAIQRLAPLSQAQAAEVCHRVLMQVLAGAAGAEFAPFAAGLGRVQELLGSHFAPAQNGSPWTSAAVGAALNAVRGAAGGLAAIGQSSWGPTGFAIVPTAADAQALLDEVAPALDPALVVRVVAARNRGATVADHALR